MPEAPRSLTVWTAANLMLVLIGPLIARALDFISVRAAVVGGAVVIATGLVLATLVHQYWLLLVIFGFIVPIGPDASSESCRLRCWACSMFPARAGMVNGLIALKA